jgi:hypothetical protein
MFLFRTAHYVKERKKITGVFFWIETSVKLFCHANQIITFSLLFKHSIQIQQTKK